MSLSPQFERALNGGESAPDSALVREQLRRLLAHPLFTNSKRYPVLLAYTVHQTLDGNAGDLKERTIGIEAFGREPDYDVNLDPVVRITAAEVRKRLVQYYYNPDHAGELVIEMPVGSYVPSFREPAILHAHSSSESFRALEADSSPTPPPPDATIAPAKFSTRHWILIGIALLLAGTIGFGIGHAKLPGSRSNLQRFWAPITTTWGTVTYCVGQRGGGALIADSATGRAPERPVELNDSNPPSELNLSDVITLARSIGPLVLGKSSFRVVSALEANFAQLREGPVVLIGAYNNPWTMRIAQDLPLGFADNNSPHKIFDRKDPQKAWASQWRVPHTKLAQDYAIVARFHDNVTGQPVIILAGLLAEGTEAASEVVSNPEHLNEVIEKLPKDWDQKNVEAVIETNVIDGHAGPPTVVAVETW